MTAHTHTSVYDAIAATVRVRTDGALAWLELGSVATIWPPPPDGNGPDAQLAELADLGRAITAQAEAARQAGRQVGRRGER